jgi:hypothetical protein
VRLNRRKERTLLAELHSRTPQLTPDFERLTPDNLLKHFRERKSPSFFKGFEFCTLPAFQEKLRPEESKQIIKSAWLITREHRWALLGFGELDFGKQINWHRDPLSGRSWPLEFHADINLWPNDDSDIRVLWELNRLGHFLTLGQAFALTRDERFAEEFFLQIESWREQNPVALGANWSCAMEVALRAMNLLATFEFFRQSAALNEERLHLLLKLLEQHGMHIRRNLEFSYTGTSNHYLADIAGLLWIGLLAPELTTANEWRDWALPELLREMDKQVFPDGADFEASTGYHRFVLELSLYSFILCRENNIEISAVYWQKLAAMLGYLQSYLRPDGKAPLMGDSDGGQVMPIGCRSADDHGYLLALGAIVLQEPRFKLAKLPGPQELLWILGEQAVSEYERLPVSQEGEQSAAFPQAGTYVLRKDDLHLVFNACVTGRSGRTSHGHNDALSIEGSACGRAFIVDPGTFVYTADLRERHLFRSTAYHSTLQVDNAEQNSTYEREPFLIGREARPRVLLWETSKDRDLLVAEHDGYKRLEPSLLHRRSVMFDKNWRWWLVEDEVTCSGECAIAVRFHFDAGLEVSVRQQSAIGWDKISGARLFVCSLELPGEPYLEPQFVSRDYGSKEPSVSACWLTRTNGNSKFRWALVPVCANDDEAERLRVIKTNSAH